MEIRARKVLEGAIRGAIAAFLCRVQNGLLTGPLPLLPLMSTGVSFK
jgi:hypothetical protein